jgi:hypothetical protein
MGVQGKWHTWQVQGMIGCKRVLIARGHWLRIDLFSYTKHEHHMISYSHGSTIWLEGPSNGHEECLPRWRFGATNLHVSTRGFSSSKEGASCVQSKERFRWLEVGTWGMVH